MNTQRAGVSDSEASTYRPGRDALDEDEPTKLLHAFFHVLWRSRFRGQLWLRQDLVKRMYAGG
jgi:hypothetical protein